MDKPSKMVQHMKGSHKIPLENVYSGETKRIVVKQIFSAPTQNTKKRWDEENQQEVVRKQNQEKHHDPIPTSPMAYPTTGEATVPQVHQRYPPAPIKPQPTISFRPTQLPPSRNITHTFTLSPYCNQDSPMSTQHVDATFLDPFVQKINTTQPSINAQQSNHTHHAGPLTTISNPSSNNLDDDDRWPSDPDDETSAQPTITITTDLTKRKSTTKDSVTQQKKIKKPRHLLVNTHPTQLALQNS